MSGGSFCYCPACRKISILGATCPCGQRTDMPARHPGVLMTGSFCGDGCGQWRKADDEACPSCGANDGAAS